MDRLQKYLAIFRDIVLPLVAALLGYQSMCGTATPTRATTPTVPYCPPPVVAPPIPGSPQLPAPVPQPQPQADPVAATVRIHVGNRYCTATVLADRPGPGVYYLLSANHCVRGASEGIVELRDGSKATFKVLRTNAAADLALSTFHAPDGLLGAVIADSEPQTGTPVWHQGYGVDRPGNREEGTVIGQPGIGGQLSLRLSVSSGDSGSGIFRADNGHLVSVVCCTGGGRTYGGSVTAIRKLMGGLSISGCCP